MFSLGERAVLAVRFQAVLLVGLDGILVGTMPEV